MQRKPNVPRLAILMLSVPLLWTALVLKGCDLFPDAPPDNEIFDGPLDDLTGAQMALHIAGDEEFGRRFTTAEGLGPIFIATSCDACHPGDARGHPTFDVVRFGRMDGGVFDPMIAHGGPQLQNRSIPGYPAEVVPVQATGVARLTPPSVTGLGFLEAVDDATLWALADPDDLDGDGISGRPQLIENSEFLVDIIAMSRLVDGESRNIPVNGSYIGRFGKKGASINLLHQTVSAYHQDMGLTTDLIPDDLTNVQVVGSAGEDTVPDPEISSSIVSNVVFYLRTLRVPERRDENDPDVVAGERLFEQINCSACHVPTLVTGVSNIPQLNQKEFHPYTDLLLHDMGPELDDGFTEGIATTSEWRTAPLWGLGLAERFQGGRAYYLHDGRANSIEAAIQFHGGEGSASRSAFNTLSEAEKQQLIAFLNSL